MLNTIRNGFFLFTVVSLILISLPVQADLNTAEAINKAGRQRMLSQQIARNYIMIGSDVNTQDAVKELQNNIELFEQQFIELAAYAPNEDIAVKLNDVSEIWLQYKDEALKQPDWDNSLTIIELSDQLLIASESVVKAIETHANHQAGKLVNISGRQRMLSQRT